MTSTNDPETYRNRWNDYIDELSKLKMSLDPNADEWDRIDEIQTELTEIVDTAASGVGDDE